MRYAVASRLLLAGLVSLTGLAGAANTAMAQAAGDLPAIPVNQDLQELITDLARQVIPHEYKDEKKWGKTKEVVGGLYVKREGLRIKTHRTRKNVNHGTWTKYRIQLLDPDRQLQVRLERVRQLPNQRLAFQIVCTARLRTFGRLSQWQRGVQLISISAEADAEVELTIQCELGIYFDLSSVPPDLVLDPVVQDADLLVRDFRMRRISQLRGPVVKQLSASVREVLEDVVERRRNKLVARVNQQLDKHKDKLRLSLRDALESKWGDLRSLNGPFRE